MTKENIIFGERLSNVGDTLKSIDERTKTLSEELIGKKAVKKVTGNVKTIVVTAIITVVTGVIVGAILYYLRLI